VLLAFSKANLSLPLAYSYLSHPLGYGLLDAMSCIEIMHDKMDSNLNHAAPPPALPIFQADHFDALLDRLLALEFMYLDGNLLSQTTYTCQVRLTYPYEAVLS
jgi:hypothetical protein